MQLLAVCLNVSIAWGIAFDDPKAWPLNAFRGWSLVNPFLFKPLRRLKREPEWMPASEPTYIADSLYHCKTNGFMLASTGMDPEMAWDEAFLPEWQERLIGLIRSFRYASKQFSLLPEITSIERFEASTLPYLFFPGKGGLCRAPAWEILTAITADTFNKINRADISTPAPIYDTLLLDAMEAVTREHFSTAVLLSAAAVEALAREKLVRAAENKDRLAALEDIPSAKLNKLLGELSHSVLGKSIDRDNPELYSSVLMLQKRRNELARTGALHEKVDYAAIWAAMDAIQCAIQVIQWFGEAANYVSPLDCNGSLLCNACDLEL